MSDAIYQYRWTESFRSPISAEVAGTELRRIEVAAGGLTPRAVVDASKPKGAPLHVMFEWDNKRAADAWRLEQARKTISSLRVVVHEQAPPVPAFASVRVPEIDAETQDSDDTEQEARPTFINMQRVEGDVDLRMKFLWGELRNVEGCLARTASYEEMAPLREAARAVHEALRPTVEVEVVASAAD